VAGPAALVAEHASAIVCDDPESAIASILELFHVPIEPPAAGIHPAAVVDPAAKLAAGVRVGAHAVIRGDVQIGSGSVIFEGVSIGRGVLIGRDCVLHPSAVVYDRCRLGDRVIVHAGAVIGADGFGFRFRDGRHLRNPHIGTVVIEDDVEIGANSCVDRAKVGITRVGRGSKIDNLVQVAHNVNIGEICVLAAQTGLAGSVKIGRGAAFGGHSGAVDNVSIGPGARLGATSVVISDLAAGETVLGFPAYNAKRFMRDTARLRRLNELFEQVAELSKRVAQLESATDHLRNR